MRGGDSGPETVKGTISSEAPAVVETVRGTTSTSTTVADVKAPEGAAHDIYIGSVSVTDEAGDFLEVLDSVVEISIADGSAQMMIDVTFEAIWVSGDENNEDCVSTNHWVLLGTGSAVSSMDIDLSADVNEVLAISGCEVDEEGDDETLPFSGSRLDLGLLVETEHHRPIRRIHV
jgi:hypothetical protein